MRTEKRRETRKRERERGRNDDGGIEAPFILAGDRTTVELSNKRGDLGFVTVRRQIRYAEEGSLARTFVERRRILNCLPHNVALHGSSCLLAIGILATC